jgi:signal transduction histidine kinase
MAAIGLAAAAGLAGAFGMVVHLPQRRRHDALAEQASRLESLLESLAAISALREERDIVERTEAEAARLFDARARFLAANGDALAGARLEGTRMHLPLVAGGEAVGALEIDRPAEFERRDLVTASVLGDFAARALENARLLAEAGEREAERAQLAEQLITAEQDERRRLSVYLHDGPLSQMSGIALMHDAALAAIADGRYEDAERVVRSSLERERTTIRELRDLTFALEPLVLRDQGFVAAVRSLGEQVERGDRITVSLSVDAGERLGEKAQVALYQIIREAVTWAVRRRPTRIEVSVSELADGRFETLVVDDGMGERRRAAVEAVEDRVRILNGRADVENRPEGGTAVRVVLPSYVAAATG